MPHPNPQCLVGQTQFQKSIQAVATSKVTYKVERSAIGIESNITDIIIKKIANVYQEKKRTKNVK